MTGRRDMMAGLRNAFVAVVFAAMVSGCMGYLAERAERDVRSKVPPSSVELSDLKYRKLADSMIEVTGRVKNRSTQYTIRGLSLKITLRDCRGNEKDDSKCDAIGEVAKYLFLTIPPGHIRDFEDQIFFWEGKINPRGRLATTVEVMYTEAE